MLAMGLQFPDPRSSVNFVNLKLNNSGLALDTMPGRRKCRVRVTGNFTLSPKLASSISFLFLTVQKYAGQFSDSHHQRNVPFRFRIQTIRFIYATFLIAKRKSMNWTRSDHTSKLLALVRVCHLSGYRRKRSYLFHEEDLWGVL